MAWRGGRFRDSNYKVSVPMRKFNTYALIENGVVVNTIVANISFIAKQPGEWTELDKKDFKNASPGFFKLGDDFVPQRPFKDWILEDKRWKAPKDKPQLQADEVAQWDEKK